VEGRGFSRTEKGSLETGLQPRLTAAKADDNARCLAGLKPGCFHRSGAGLLPPPWFQTEPLSGGGFSPRADERV